MDISQRVYTSTSSVQGVCALVHGLNQLPEVLEPLIGCLTKAGYHCHLLTLRGHESDGWEALKAVQAHEWMDEVYNFLHYVEKEAAKISQPMHLVAYSLGALLTLNAYRRPEDLKLPSRAVFIAPAFALHRRSYLLKLVLPFVSRLPSFAPKDMRAHELGLPAGAYRALFELVDDLHKPWPENLLSLPSLILVDPKDELVSYKGILRLARERKWKAMQVEEVSAGGAPKPSYHHLISSPVYLSESEWNRVTRLMVGFLNPIVTA